MRVRERERIREGATHKRYARTHTHGLKHRESGIHTDKEVEMHVERKK